MTGKDDTTDDDDPIRKMAAEYVDIWEQQMRTLAKDEALAETMAQTLQLMNAGAAGMAAMMQGFQQNAGGGQDGTDVAGGPGKGDAGAPAAAAASGDADPDLRDIARRLADIEKRLDRLEGRAAPARKRSKRSAD